MNRRLLRARGADLSSRRTAEDAIDSSKRNHNLTWEEAAKRTANESVKWSRKPRRRAAADGRNETLSVKR
jgi:hypothetical protein